MKISMPSNGLNISLADAFDQFQRFNQAKRLSSSTIKDYENCFRNFR